MGERRLRNIAHPTRAYAVNMTAIRPPAPVQTSVPQWSIAVLPFANLSNDPEQEYFADAIIEDLTTDLSRIEGMFVISRNTAFTYKGKPANAKEVGRELGVRYVLEGSVRRLASHIRVNAQLIDTETAAHLWAERFDREVEDRFAVTLNLKLIGVEAARPIEHPVARDFIFRGRAALLVPPTPENRAEAIRLFDHALALDPRSIEAQCRLATVLVVRVMNNMTDSPADDIARAEELIEQALAASPDYAPAHPAKGQLLQHQGRPDEAAFEYENVALFDRNITNALSGLAWCKMMAGGAR
jgi:adenylate cyclase